MSKDFWNNEKDKIFDVLRKASVDRALAKIRNSNLDISAYAWLTSYQIAAVLCEENPNILEEYEAGIGGSESGYNSIAQRISESLINHYSPNENYEYCQLSNMSNNVVLGKGTWVTELDKNTNIFRYRENND